MKTVLNKQKDFLNVYRKLASFYEQIGSSRFVGLFAWDGLSLNKSLSVIWNYVRESPLDNLRILPSAIYVRSKYLLLKNIDGRRETAPFRVFKISNKGITEGEALLTLMVEIWSTGISKLPDLPWWLASWWRKLPEIQSLVPWPEDLQKVVDDSLKT